MRGFIYKCVQVDVYPALSPLLINMTRENLLGTQLSPLKVNSFSWVKVAVRAHGAS